MKWIYENLVIFLQAISSLRSREDTIEKIEDAIDFVNDHLPSDDSSIRAVSSSTLNYFTYSSWSFHDPFDFF